MIGILALQGDFREHEEILQQSGVAVQQVRLPKHLDTIDRLIIPGGESTTIGRLLYLYHLIEPLRERVASGMPVWGTCAGTILMASEILDARGEGQPYLGVMNITVRRNAFGRQLDSFETTLDMPVVGLRPVPSVFIRAPRIEATGAGVEVLATLPDGSIAAVRQGNLLATTFHPELTGDGRLHQYFLEF